MSAPAKTAIIFLEEKKIYLFEMFGFLWFIILYWNKIVIKYIVQKSKSTSIAVELFGNVLN